MKLVDLKLTERHEGLHLWVIEYINLWGVLKSHSLSEEDDIFKKDIKHKLLIKLQTILTKSKYAKIKEDDEVGKYIDVLRKELDDVGFDKFEEKYISYKFDFYAILIWFLDNYQISRENI